MKNHTTNSAIYYVPYSRVTLEGEIFHELAYSNFLRGKISWIDNWFVIFGKIFSLKNPAMRYTNKMYGRKVASQESVPGTYEHPQGTNPRIAQSKIKHDQLNYTYIWAIQVNSTCYSCSKISSRMCDWIWDFLLSCIVYRATNCHSSVQ